MKKQVKKVRAAGSTKSKGGDSLPKDLLKQIGERLKALRIAKGYSSYEIFAYEHELTRSLYGKYERGTKDLRIRTLEKLAKIHGLTVKEFFSKGFD